MTKHDSFKAVLAAAREQGCDINRTKLAKLLYLCDLAAVEAGSEPFTGFEWRWRHYGPYDNALLEVEEELMSSGDVQRVRGETYFGDPEYQLTLSGTAAVRVEEAVWVTVTNIMSKFGNLQAQQLRDITYGTVPMRDAVADGTKESLLDLESARPQPDLRPAVDRLRPILDGLGQQETDPEALDEIRGDMAALDTARRTATRRLLE